MAGAIHSSLSFTVRGRFCCSPSLLSWDTHSQSLPPVWRTPEEASQVTQHWVRFGPSSLLSEGTGAVASGVAKSTDILQPLFGDVTPGTDPSPPALPPVALLFKRKLVI